MAADPVRDASPLPNCQGDPPEARPDSLCTSPSNPDDSGSDVVCRGSPSNALSPPDGKTPSPPDDKTPREKRRPSSPLSSPDKRQASGRKRRSSSPHSPRRPKRQALGLTTPPPTSPISPSPDAESPALASSDGRSECPFCMELINEDRRRKLPSGLYVSFQKKFRFCSGHWEDKAREGAREEWKARGYPIIDWEKLDARIAPHIDHLKEILYGKKECYYKDIYEQDIKTRTRRDEDDHLPGYYGPKGFRVMLEGIEARLFDSLRKMAYDELVSARGHAMYVQAVLVRELAVRFVMEDMGVGMKDARRILEESREVGGILCENEGDTIGEDDRDIILV